MNGDTLVIFEIPGGQIAHAEIVEALESISEEGQRLRVPLD